MTDYIIKSSNLGYDSIADFNSEFLVMAHQFKFDVIIVGSGAAGLATALRLPKSLSIGIIAKASLKEQSSYYAQGGISAVLEKDDSVDLHTRDTLDSGADLGDEAVIRKTVSAGRDTVEWLTELGMPFTRDQQDPNNSGLHLTREGGHSRRRVVHAADATGKALQKTLYAHAVEQDNVKILNRHIVIDLITAEGECQGLYALNLDSQHVDAFRARKVVLATGGASKVYLYTSNPDGSTGDGIAMAWRAGCRVANMEFIQFHPTCLYHPEAKSFLISEAVRGEGGRLLLPDGSRFMQDFDERGELAPRDIVARAIDHEMKRLGTDCVYLDISHKSRAFVKSHFPSIYEKCLQYDIDITKQPIPVVPAAHYTCGGVLVDECGRTDVQNLYAIGETSYTGLHGANRMASNSLLECLVYAQAAADDIGKSIKTGGKLPWVSPWDESKVTDSDEDVVVAHNWDELRRFMWDYVGIVRTDKRLERAQHRCNLLAREIDEYYGNYKVSSDLIELRNLVTVASLIIRSAMARKESRGLHYTLDYPQRDEKYRKATILVPDSKAENRVIPLHNRST